MTRARALRLLRVLVAVLILVAVAVALVKNWAAVSRDLARVDPGALAAASVLALVAPVLTMLGWRVLLADLGSRLHLAPAAGIFFVGQLGKYLPGSVWSVLAQAEMAATLHVPRRRSGVVGLIGIGLGILTGLLVGLPALPLLLRTQGGGVGWLALALPLLVACWPPLLNRLIALGLRVLRREPLEQELSGSAVAWTVVLFLGAWLSLGAQVWILARSVAGDVGGSGFLLSTVAGYALAASLGMLTVIAPAGVGVREVLLALMLGTAVSSSSATAVVVLSRFVITLADVAVAAVGWAYARSHHLVSAHPGRGLGRLSDDLDSRTGGQVDGGTGGQVDGGTGGQVDGRTGGQLDGGTGGQVDGGAR